MIIKAEFTAGSTILDACREAQWFADDHGVTVKFDFNGVTCLACKGGSYEWLAESQQQEQNRKSRGIHDIRMASSAVRPTMLAEREKAS